jgi:hypothetical protein
MYINENAISASEWSEVHKNCAIFSMQGRRPNNEDRAIFRQPNELTHVKPNQINLKELSQEFGSGHT